MGNGRQWMSWIHLDDLIAISLHIINHRNIRGAVNATSLTRRRIKKFHQPWRMY